MTSPLLRAGLVGFGTAAQFFHMPLLLASGRFEITHVLERSKALSRESLPRATIVRTLAELVATDIDVVIIATPTDMHFEQAKMALLAGKHVVVDKPMCVTHAQATELIGLATTQKVVLTVFQNRRWDADFLTVRKLIESQTLGALEHFEVHFDRYRPTLKGNWKESPDAAGGGMLYDLGAHLVDQMLTLFGPPASIHADVQSQRDGCENDDYFRLECSYESGLLVVLTAGMLVKDPAPKYIVRGANGIYTKFGEDGQETALRAGRTPATEGEHWGLEAEEQWGRIERASEATEVVRTEPGNYGAFYKGLADTLQFGTPQLVRPEESAAAIAIIEQAKASFLASKQ
ncbi:hypothetical protein ACHHYP_05314 [Achlya hypogyna]|uniref:Oxidoreductase n=1 Tax=Achlya hypogyna TaxID=1202772 RepID=A0A1V9YYG9_ACHHY|nr:hypothetical protein ACHHYP_05314 [Achlya hypogyna]